MFVRRKSKNSFALPREYSASLSSVQTEAPCDFQLEVASIIYQVSAASQSPTIQFCGKKQRAHSKVAKCKEKKLP